VALEEHTLEEHTGVPEAVAAAREILLASVLYGAWTLWLVLAQVSPPLAIAGGATPLAARWVLRRLVKRRLIRGGRPSLTAWIPVLCVVAAYAGYGITVSVVQQHYYERRLVQYERSLAHTDEGLSNEERRETDRLERSETHLRHVSLQGLIAQISKATKVSERFLEGRTRGLGTFGRSVDSTRHELPPWFERLRGFFTVATQILAAVVVVLVFSRWREGPAEAVFRSAMPVVAVALAFGLAGTLPSLSRSLQAILLAPVLAGLAGAIGALIVVALDTRVTEMR
jgi:hypothetical protein